MFSNMRPEGLDVNEPKVMYASAGYNRHPDPNLKALAGTCRAIEDIQIFRIPPTEGGNLTGDKTLKREVDVPSAHDSTDTFQTLDRRKITPVLAGPAAAVISAAPEGATALDMDNPPHPLTDRADYTTGIDPYHGAEGRPPDSLD